MKKNLMITCWLIGLLLIQPRVWAQAADRTQALDAVLDSFLLPEGVRPVHSLLVYLRDGDYVYHKAIGKADGSQRPVEKDFSFKIASVTKTFTATVALQMVEEGKVSLDDPIYPLVKELAYIQVDSLLIIEGKNYATDITVRHLLQHRSGLADLFFDEFQAFMAHWQANKRKYWTPDKHFEFYYQLGLHKKGHGKPGSVFHYSDVNYFLLGLMIEQLSGESLAQQIRKRILDPLKMEHSYFEYFEPDRDTQYLAYSFMGAENISKTSSTSFDWAGGGLVSSTRDMATFIEALLGGKLFKDASTLEQMMDTREAASMPFQYGMGLLSQEVDGKTYYGHSGFWGVFMLRQPESDITLVLSANQVMPPFNYNELIGKLVRTPN